MSGEIIGHPWDCERAVIERGYTWPADLRPEALIDAGGEVLAAFSVAGGPAWVAAPLNRLSTLLNRAADLDREPPSYSLEARAFTNAQDRYKLFWLRGQAHAAMALVGPDGREEVPLMQSEHLSLVLKLKQQPGVARVVWVHSQKEDSGWYCYCQDSAGQMVYGPAGQAAGRMKSVGWGKTPERALEDLALKFELVGVKGA